MAAQLPLNSFKVKAFELTTSSQVVYECPVGITCIVLGTQASNISNQPATITFTLTKNGVDFILLKEFEVPTNDCAEVTTGKLVVEEGHVLKAIVSRDNTINLVLSILETSNE